MPNPIQAVASATSTSFPFTVTPFNVDLDGSGSSTTNLGATIVEYAWLLKDKPSGSGATVTQPSGIGSPVGRLEDIDLPGTYLLFLQVKDSTGAWSDAFLPASENARVAITMTTEHRAWKIPARSERLWDDEMYTLLIGLDSLLGATLVDDTTIGFNGSTQLYVKNGGIGTTQLAALAVTAAKLGNDVAGNGLGGGNGSALSVNVDDATIEVNADTLRLKDAGVTTAKLGSQAVTAAKLGNDVAGSGLGGGSGTALSVNVDNSTIEVNADTLRLKDAGVSTAKLAGTSVTAAKLGSDVAGSGLTGGNGSALAVRRHGGGTGCRRQGSNERAEVANVHTGLAGNRSGSGHAVSEIGHAYRCRIGNRVEIHDCELEIFGTDLVLRLNRDEILSGFRRVLIANDHEFSCELDSFRQARTGCSGLSPVRGNIRDFFLRDSHLVRQGDEESIELGSGEAGSVVFAGGCEILHVAVVDLAEAGHRLLVVQFPLHGQAASEKRRGGEHERELTTGPLRLGTGAAHTVRGIVERLIQATPVAIRAARVVTEATGGRAECGRSASGAQGCAARCRRRRRHAAESVAGGRSRGHGAVTEGR